MFVSCIKWLQVDNKTIVSMQRESDAPYPCVIMNKKGKKW